MVTQFSRVQDYAEIKMRKKQALRAAPKLTTSTLVCLRSFPQRSDGKKKVKFKSIITKQMHTDLIK